ncbi:tetratricopeptide repeat protein [Pedobacter jamesrossensis]|uniref:Tetratricopeptide repeat-containing protein n=1 Tax=Pedobacter jamesrossensis TaxID=1908238 RepID=A0ABV8NQM6_9SPHI
MKKFFFITLLLSVGLTSVFAQQKSIEDLYWDYTMVRMGPAKRTEAIDLGLALLNRKTELKAKQIANVTYHLGRLYEERNQMDKAVPYYESSIKLTPGYYVPYLALGNYYFKDCKEMGAKINQAELAKDAVLYEKNLQDYKKFTSKTAAYLEKSYACDPDEKTKGMITYLYQSSKNPEALKTFDSRIKTLEEGCITLLDDE